MSAPTVKRHAITHQTPHSDTTDTRHHRTQCAHIYIYRTPYSRWAKKGEPRYRFFAKMRTAANAHERGPRPPRRLRTPATTTIAAATCSLRRLAESRRSRHSCGGGQGAERLEQSSLLSVENLVATSNWARRFRRKDGPSAQGNDWAPSGPRAFVVRTTRPALRACEDR